MERENLFAGVIRKRLDRMRIRTVIIAVESDVAQCAGELGTSFI